jgi:hypothetical protein
MTAWWLEIDGRYITARIVGDVEISYVSGVVFTHGEICGNRCGETVPRDQLGSAGDPIVERLMRLNGCYSAMISPKLLRLTILSETDQAETLMTIKELMERFVGRQICHPDSELRSRTLQAAAA